MATKNHPGKFDCYQNAKPDEPMFVLLARDELASHLVRAWAHLRMGEHGAAVISLNKAYHFAKEKPAMDPEKYLEAITCANAMEEWNRVAHSPIPPRDDRDELVRVSREAIIAAYENRSYFTINELLEKFDTKVAAITPSEGPSKAKLPASPDAGGGPIPPPRVDEKEMAALLADAFIKAGWMGEFDKALLLRFTEIALAFGRALMEKCK